MDNDTQTAVPMGNSDSLVTQATVTSSVSEATVEKTYGKDETPPSASSTPSAVTEAISSADQKLVADNDSLMPTATVRRASITFKFKKYDADHDNVVPSNTSELLGPNWAGARLSRASSPALSVQSESSDRSSSKNNGTRPATFLFTLTTFLRENPKSPYMRWSENGTYFIVPDKAGLMDKVIPDLFNQNSYSSFARQLNIYGWRRLQSSPDGKVTSSSCTIWKHDQITRETPDEDLKHVKRNAQDKSRRNSKGMDDEEEEYPVVTRPRRAVTMSSTTAAEAMAARAALAVGSTNLRYSSTSFEERKRPADSLSTSASNSPPHVQMPSVLAPVPTRAKSHLPSVLAQTAQPVQNTQAPAVFTQSGRVSRPLPMRRPPSRSFSYSGRTMRKRHDDTPPETTESETTDSMETETDSPVIVPRRNEPVVALPAPQVENRQPKRLRRDTNPEMRAPHVLAHRRVLSSESHLRILPFQVAASRQVIPQNPIDVYVACVEDNNSVAPAYKGRDRLDIPIWVDDFSQARFVLAGEIMRAWALWDVVPSNALIYIALSDASKPPRPLGIVQQLKDNVANGDPNRAYSRERIYLENSTEPGCVGQCCLVFRKTTPEEEANSKDSAQAPNPILGVMKPVPDLEPWTGAIPVPPTPKFQSLATSSERRPLLCETKSGRKVSDRFLDSPALSSPSMTVSSTALRTPKTADAISSLAAMQALARSFTPVSHLNESPSSANNEDVDMKPIDPSVGSAVPRSMENSDVKPGPSINEMQLTPSISAGSG